MSRMRSRAWQFVKRRSCQNGENRKHCEKSYAAFTNLRTSLIPWLGRCCFLIPGA